MVSAKKVSTKKVSTTTIDKSDIKEDIITKEEEKELSEAVKEYIDMKDNLTFENITTIEQLESLLEENNMDIYDNKPLNKKLKGTILKLLKLRNTPFSDKKEDGRFKWINIKVNDTFSIHKVTGTKSNPKRAGKLCLKQKTKGRAELYHWCEKDYVDFYNNMKEKLTSAKNILKAIEFIQDVIYYKEIIKKPKKKKSTIKYLDIEFNDF